MDKAELIGRLNGFVELGATAEEAIEAVGGDGFQKRTAASTIIVERLGNPKFRREAFRYLIGQLSATERAKLEARRVERTDDERYEDLAWGCPQDLWEEDSSVANKKKIEAQPDNLTAPPWSREEEEILRKHYPVVGLRGIMAANLLPGRSQVAISKRVKRLGLRMKAEWTDEMDARLTAMWRDGASLEEIADSMDLTVAAVEARAKKLNLSRDERTLAAIDRQVDEVRVTIRSQFATTLERTLFVRDLERAIRAYLDDLGVSGEVTVRS